jgi:UDP-glucose:(heptosyl)LPS alpha-1,3-glucosyltransferase
VKLAFLLYRYFPYGGMQRDFRRFVEELLLRGHVCRIYCHRWDGDVIAGTQLRRVPVKALQNHRRNERFLCWVQDDLRADPVDAVVGFNKMPGLDIYFAADSCYVDWALHERGRMYRLSPRYRHFAAWERAVFQRGGHTDVLLISATERDKFLHHYHTEAERLHMLPPGIDPARRAPPDSPERRLRKRAELDLPGDCHTLLFVGSGFRKKGLDRAIRSVAQLQSAQPGREVRLLIAGQDREYPFRRLARRLGVERSVRFLGGRDDVSDLMLAADALVHPALDEAAGIVLLEALVAGLPVLVTDICGYAHYIADAGCGIVLDSPFRQEALDTAVRHSLDPGFLQRCSSAGLAYAAREDLYSMHRTGAEIIERLARRSADRG